MKGTRGHDHDTFESGLACKTARLLHDVSGGTACAVVMACYAEDGKSDPGVSVIGNATSLAHMALGLIETALEMPRPNDCHHCAANWDNLARARAAFLVVEGSC